MNAPFRIKEVLERYGYGEDLTISYSISGFYFMDFSMEMRDLVLELDCLGFEVDSDSHKCTKVYISVRDYKYLLNTPKRHTI